MYFTPLNNSNEIKMIKVVAKISVRPSQSKLSSHVKHDVPMDDVHAQHHHNHDHNLENKMDLNNADPESLAFWNHPVYKHNL
jgi:hypothetical protein